MLTLELWVASLSRKGVSYGQVLSGLSAVRHHVKKHGRNAKLSSHRLELMLKSLKKKKKTTPEKKAVTLSHLKRLCRVSNILNTPEALLLRAMTTLAFFGFLRPSELCMSTSGHTLLRKDVKLGKNETCCYVRFKTFKHSVATQKIKIDKQAPRLICPVENLSAYLDSTTTASPERPLFDITTTEFKNTLDTLCHAAKIKSKITPHCFRVGGATWASKQGWSESRIQSHGRWKSGAYKTYIKAY